ncbi:hypothetical protein [Pseudomonas matsuisoli]|uniref:Uncharacterized protein n=1 Tax=Pseudomonas matsuisoli TaxID=1515666 RepID=A0A917UR88_9PSED|nr:hypothetical protein [Pseudomonas matsuisoli]GGJ78542.1 hypothetical protein GCM10009304_00540 [Pseudomonas matsuisoli]
MTDARDKNGNASESYASTRDEAGRPVDVVRRDFEKQDDGKPDGIDSTITPSSNRKKEQDVEAINEKAAAAERKLNR